MCRMYCRFRSHGYMLISQAVMRLIIGNTFGASS